tara:strand:- start:633 stop:773 length:141 start_codon:yes stop_codon:yes gene_type:complete
VWRSLEARFLGMEEAPSSNLGTSTTISIIFNQKQWFFPPMKLLNFK